MVVAAPTDTAPPGPDGELEDRRSPTTTLESWRSFIAADPSSFDLLPAQDWDVLDEPARRSYDETRIAHHAELEVQVGERASAFGGPVLTSHGAQVLAVGVATIAAVGALAATGSIAAPVTFHGNGPGSSTLG